MTTADALNAAQMIRAAGYIHPAEVIEQQAAYIEALEELVYCNVDPCDIAGRYADLYEQCAAGVRQRLPA